MAHSPVRVGIVKGMFVQRTKSAFSFFLGIFFGLAEIHPSSPIKTGHGQEKRAVVLPRLAPGRHQSARARPRYLTHVTSGKGGGLCGWKAAERLVLQPSG